MIFTCAPISDLPPNISTMICPINLSLYIYIHLPGENLESMTKETVEDETGHVGGHRGHGQVSCELQLQVILTWIHVYIYHTESIVPFIIYKRTRKLEVNFMKSIFSVVLNKEKDKHKRKT